MLGEKRVRRLRRVGNITVTTGYRARTDLRRKGVSDGRGEASILAGQSEVSEPFCVSEGENSHYISRKIAAKGKFPQTDVAKSLILMPSPKIGPPRGCGRFPVVSGARRRWPRAPKLKTLDSSARSTRRSSRIPSALCCLQRFPPTQSLFGQTGSYLGGASDSTFQTPALPPLMSHRPGRRQSVQCSVRFWIGNIVFSRPL